MKKYIRTKDGIYDLETKNNDGECENQIADIEEISYGGKNGSCVLIPQKCILAEADTIEELCNLFVLALKDSKKSANDNMYDKEEYYDLYQHIGYAKNYYNEDYHDLYGAIWTEWGLRYVAKMNDKGELELI